MTAGQANFNSTPSPPNATEIYMDFLTDVRKIQASPLPKGHVNGNQCDNIIASLIF